MKTNQQPASERVYVKFNHNTSVMSFEKIMEQDDDTVAIVKVGKIRQAIQQARAEVAEELVTLSDKIEMQHDSPDMNEWRAFKAFRNTARCLYLTDQQEEV